MLEKLKKVLLLLIITVLSFSSISISSSAQETNNIGSEYLNILSDEIPKDAIDVVTLQAAKYISCFITNPDFTDVSFNGMDDISIGKGYYTYSEIAGKLVKNEIINFPVIQNNTVILLLSVYNNEGTWQIKAGKSYSERLNFLKSTSKEEPYRIVYLNQVGYAINSKQKILLDESESYLDSSDDVVGLQNSLEPKNVINTSETNSVSYCNIYRRTS